jgi:beta-fructofuranosidase
MRISDADLQAWTAITQAHRAARAGDRFRPLCHFLPPSGWMNDPVGLIHWHGEYHLFYGHNPCRPATGLSFWGHASSRDLSHWRDLPIALTPGEAGPDLHLYDKPTQERTPDYTYLPALPVAPEKVDYEGVWSGCCVDDRGTPTIVYTARPGLPEWQCLATSPDGLRSWRKEECNPVLADPPDALRGRLNGFRDPYVWREDDGWAMAIGSGTDQGPMILLYRSPDLRRWTCIGPLFEGEASRYGVMWECPNLFVLGGKHVLIVSGGKYPVGRYFVGRFDGARLHAETEGLLDWSPNFYAPQTFADAAGRRLLFGWSLEGRTQQSIEAAGWGGVMTLPRLITLGPDNLLCFTPAPEVESLRGSEYSLSAASLAAGDTPLPVGGDGLEIVAELEPSAGDCGVTVLASPDGAEQTRIRYSPAPDPSPYPTPRTPPDGGHITVDRARASLSPDATNFAQITNYGYWPDPARVTAPLKLAPGEPLKLRIFIDRSIVEIFANDRVCLTSRVYTARPDSLGMGLFAESPSRLISLRAWSLRPVWPSA